jgi:hypothetical protein
MDSLTLTPAQIETLRGLHVHLQLERIDRIWIFPAHFGKSRESGLFVVSLRGDDDGAPQHTLMTVVYEVTPTQGKSVRVESAIEQGRAHPDTIERVVAGALARSGDPMGTAITEPIEGQMDRWLAFLDRIAAGS